MARQKTDEQTTSVGYDLPEKTTPATTSERQGAIVTDPEIKALSLMGKTMSGLDEESRQRCLGWLNAKFGRQFVIHHPNVQIDVESIKRVAENLRGGVSVLPQE